MSAAEGLWERDEGSLDRRAFGVMYTRLGRCEVGMQRDQKDQWNIPEGNLHVSMPIYRP